MMEKFNIQGVPETMLQTLYARAAYSKKNSRIFYDEKSVEAVKVLDYDFSSADRDMLMSKGVIARTLLLDRMVKAYIDKYPDITVVNIACGMDTRVYRLDNGKLRWYNLDLPETIEVRRRFFEENGRISTIAKSAMDESWATEVEPTEEKVLVIIEGLTMYLCETDVQKILSIVAESFANADVIMEIMSPFAVKHIKEKSISASKAKFTWGLKSGKELEQLAPSFYWVEDISLVKGMQMMTPAYRLVSWIPAVRNISNKLAVLSESNFKNIRSRI